MKDLSTVKTSMTAILIENQDLINACTTANEMAGTIKSLFAAHNIDTKASKRLVINVGKKRTATEAQFTVYNSIMAGMNESVIR